MEFLACIVTIVKCHPLYPGYSKWFVIMHNTNSVDAEYGLVYTR